MEKNEPRDRLQTIGTNEVSELILANQIGGTEKDFGDFRSLLESDRCNS
ncbi:hypothetical protein [Chroococcidiopsis sp. SAG 2025]|nr:hypothetical protein [Chroococcidiopsis sp. SAG 2025]